MNILKVSLGVCLPLLCLVLGVSSNVINLDVKIVVDNSAYQMWTKMSGVANKNKNEFEKEMRSAFYEMTLPFNKIDVKLRLVNNNIQLRDDNLFKTNTGKLSSRRALLFLHIWKKKYSKTSDILLFFTGHDIQWGGKSQSGISTRGALCSSGGAALIHMSQPMTNFLNGAYYAGRIMGAYSDGQGKAKGCRNSGKLMDKKSHEFTSLKYELSSCSADQIKKSLVLHHAKPCSWLKSSSRTYTDLSVPQLGHYITPDQACQRSFGSDSHFYRKGYSSYGDNVCGKIKCWAKVKGTFGAHEIDTLAGMNCQNSKQCIQAKCQSSNKGDKYFYECPYGDQPSIDNGKKTCSSLSNRVQCKSFKKECCKTCSDYPDAVCQLHGYTALNRFAERYMVSFHSSLCYKLECLTYGKFITYWNATTDNLDGMNCGKNKKCFGKSCRSVRNGADRYSDTCPSGNGPPLGGKFQPCHVLTKRYGCKHFAARMCCMTCPAVRVLKARKTKDEVCGLLGYQGHKPIPGANSEDTKCVYRCNGGNNEDSRILNYQTQGIECGTQKYPVKKCRNGKCQGR